MINTKDLLAVLSFALLGTAQATTSTTTVGATTTYFDDFNNAPSLFTVTGGPLSGIVNSGSDDYLFLVNNGSASFSFTSGTPIASVDVSFWFSQNDTGASATFGSTTINLPDTTAGGTFLGAGQFALNNPGAGGNSNDAFNTSLSLTNLGAGTYSLTFAAPNLAQNLTGVKFDDVTIAVTAIPAVPEPSAYALMLIGLGAVAAVRRRATR